MRAQAPRTCFVHRRQPPKEKSVCSSSSGVVRKKISSLWMHATCILEITQGVCG